MGGFALSLRCATRPGLLLVALPPTATLGDLASRAAEALGGAPPQRHRRRAQVHEHRNTEANAAKRLGASKRHETHARARDTKAKRAAPRGAKRNWTPLCT